MKNKRWIEDELKILLSMKKIRKYSYKEMAKILNRSEASILHKLHELKNVHKKEKSRYTKKSTLRNIISNHKKKVNLRKKLRKIYSEVEIKDLDKMSDSLFRGNK